MTISPAENVRMAFAALWAHRFRSGLTVMGIVIGIVTVVTVASLLTGLRAGVVTFFDELGPDNTFISKAAGPPGAGGSPKEQKRREMELEYVDLLKRWAVNIDDVGAQVSIQAFQIGRNLTARVEGVEADIQLSGQTPNLFSISPRDFSGGRPLTQDDNDGALRSVVVGANVAETLFPGQSAVDQEIMIDGAAFRIVGVLAKAKGGFFGQNDVDNVAVIPFRTAQMRYPQAKRIMITAKARAGYRKAANEEVEALMRKIRRLKPDQENDFNLATPDQIVQQFDRITGLIGLAAIAISGLGLLVGGIGVMNIMLVSVTERTREIGGVLGIVIAVLVTMLVGALVPSLPASVPTWAVGSAFVVSVTVGIFFGVWPAMKAARLDPVEALRYE
jgi:putative ABC transport system permease protein